MIHREPSTSGARYICLACKKVYTSRYNIRMHCNMHTGRNVHTCEFCGRFFAHKHVFESHVRTHTGEKPFACSKCGRTFGDRSNRLSHQKKCKEGGSGGSATKPSSNNNSNNSGLRKLAPRPPQAVLNTRLITAAPNQSIPRIVIANTFQNNNANGINQQYSGHHQVYTDNAEEDVPEEKFDPQIVSVQSMRVKEEEEEEEEEETLGEIVEEADDDDDEGEEEIVVDPSSLTDLDYDDIIDDSLYDEDLEEIQIEPDIIDYDGDDAGSGCSGSQGASSTMGDNNSVPITDADMNIFTCSFCYDQFSQQSNLISHLPQHVGIPKQPTDEDFERGYAVFKVQRLEIHAFSFRHSN